jgi:hypothetical protein
VTGAFEHFVGAVLMAALAIAACREGEANLKHYVDHAGIRYLFSGWGYWLLGILIGYLALKILVT